MTILIERPIITAILEQHLENSAFCWSRCEQDQWNPLYTQSTLRRYQDRLDANLTGLQLAGAHALAPSISRVTRWKTTDEMFVAMYVLLHNLQHKDSAQSITIIEQLIVTKPELIDGAVAAWNRLNILELNESQRNLLTRWWTSPESALRTAALGFILTNPHIESNKLIEAGLTDPSPIFKSIIFRIIGEKGLISFIPHCRTALDDTDIFCRFEASFSLTLLGDNTGLPVLRDCLPRLQGEQLKRGLLLWASKSDATLFIDWIQQFSDDNQAHRNRLWAIAFRGDLTLLAHTLAWLNAKNSQLAAYTITHITAIELEESIQSTDETDEEDISGVHLDDQGLAAINLSQVVEWIQKNTFTSNTIRCMGELMTAANAKLCLQNGTQPQRWQAALFLAQEYNSAGWQEVCKLMYAQK